MLIRVRIGKEDEPGVSYRTGHKPLSLVYSLALHAGVVALLFLPSPFGSEQQDAYHAVVVELEKDHKLIYYDFRKELPEVTASNATAKVTTPGPNALKAKQRIVTAPKENPGKQLVYLPEPRVQLKTDITAPNLIAIETPVEVPLPERPKPKPFQAPETPKTAPAPVAPLPAAPAVPANADSRNSALNALLNKPAGPVKQFIPPSQPKPAAAPAVLPNAPAVAATSNDDAAVAALFNKPVGPPPKKFTAPGLATSAKGSVPASLPTAPEIADAANDQNSSVTALLNKPVGPVRQFTAPKQGGAGTGGSSAAPVALPNAPAVGGGSHEKDSALAELLNKPPAGPPPRPFVAPKSGVGGNGTSTAGSSPAALPAPPAVPNGGPPASATVAIIGLNPANVPQIPRPEGSRPARIEAGTPVPGATQAELGGGKNGIPVPDISIQGGPAVSPATASRVPVDRTLSASNPAAIGLARPQPPKILPTTPHVSVPQWPNTRYLPAAVERHFQNRVVYTTLIPSAASDDWKVWFAELGITPIDPNLLMNPPVLLKAGVLPPIAASSDHGTGTIRLTCIIHKDGRVSSVAELAGAPADRELSEALQTWEFTPARRNGAMVDADAVIEIPVVFGKLSLR